MLTIAIPTYNRSRYLDRQLRWLATVLPGHEDSVQVLVSDNASTDDTPAVIDAWRPAFSNANFTYRRNPANVGAVSNIASCIGAASHRHVWTISDDDPVDEQALETVLDRLRERPDLGLLTLNHSAREARSGALRFAKCYPVGNDWHDPHGVDLFSYCLDRHRGGLCLTTAQVYRTDLAREAQLAWPTEENLVVQTFWSAYCAREGGMLLTGDTYLEARAGAHFFYKDPLLALRLYCADFPELGDRLAGLGIDSRACKKLTLDSIALHHRHTLLRAFRADPRTTARLLISFSRSVWRAGPFGAPGYVGAKLARKLATRFRVRSDGVTAHQSAHLPAPTASGAANSREPVVDCKELQVPPRR